MCILKRITYDITATVAAIVIIVSLDLNLHKYNKQEKLIMNSNFLLNN